MQNNHLQSGNSSRGSYQPSSHKPVIDYFPLAEHADKFHSLQNDNDIKIMIFCILYSQNFSMRAFAECSRAFVCENTNFCRIIKKLRSFRRTEYYLHDSFSLELIKTLFLAHAAVKLLDANTTPVLANAVKDVQAVTDSVK